MFRFIEFLKRLADAIYRRIERRLRRKSYIAHPMRAFSEVHKNVEMIVYRDSEQFEIAGPRFAGDYKFELPSPSSVILDAPEITVFQFRQASALGSSSIVLLEQDALYPDVANPSQDMFTIELFGDANYIASKNEIQIITTGQPLTVKSAISLLGECTGNYAHWLLETLPKLTILNDLALGQNFTLLVDSWIHPIFFESIALADVSCRSIVRVSRFQKVECENLIYVSPPSYTAPENRASFRSGARPAPSSNSYRFSPKDLSRMRELLVTEAKKYVVPNPIICPPMSVITRVGHGDNTQVTVKIPDVELLEDMSVGAAQKIYLKRTPESSGNPRHLIGIEAVEAILAAHGFLAVDPATLSFSEQVLLLQNAKCVVAPIGASMANLIFAPPGAAVIGLSPYYRDADYYYFSNLMGLLGHNLTYVLGPQVNQPNVHWLHRDYRTNLKALDDEIGAILSH